MRDICLRLRIVENIEIAQYYEKKIKVYKKLTPNHIVLFYIANYFDP